MEIKNNTSAQLSAYERSNPSISKKSENDIKPSSGSAGGRETGDQVTISDAARANEALPRYLQPTNGRPDPNASSGSVYDFLKPDDQQALKKAYNYAVDNGTSLKKVEEAAFYLGVQRHKEARVTSGTEYSQHIPDKNKAFINASPANRAQELEKLLIADPDNKFLQTVKRAEEGPFFGTENPLLNQELFTGAVDKHLGVYSSKNSGGGTTSNVFDFLNESDKIEIEKAHQEANEKALSSEDVEKAAFLLAIERLNDNANSNLHGGAALFQSRVDTPTKLIELARNELGEQVAESFIKAIGQLGNRPLFGENKVLQQSLFTDPAAKLLNMKSNT